MNSTSDSNVRRQEYTTFQTRNSEGSFEQTRVPSTMPSVQNGLCRGRDTGDKCGRS